MEHRRSLYSVVLAVAIVGLMVTTGPSGLSTLGATPGSHSSPGPTARASAERAPAAAPAQGSTSGSPAPAASTGTSPIVAAVEREISDHLLNGRNAFLPSPVVHSAQPAPGQTVSVVPLSSPGPMGLADLGIGPDDSPYEYNTSAFEGTLHIASFSAYSPGYAEFADAPNWTTIQLNAVGTNLTYPGSTAGTFWFQNVVHFNGAELQFEDNVWNFSSPTSAMLPGTFYSYSPYGHLGEYDFYYAFGPTIPVTYPFTLSLELTLGAVDGRPAASFSYAVTTTAGTASGTYDTVVFNGLAAHPAQFRVDGGAYDPFGDNYDTELTIGGDGGGRNANLVALGGNATLERWSDATDRFVNVPSAYDHGVDSGETSAGVAATFISNQTAIEHLSQGPSFLGGLWNTTGGAAGPALRPGYIRVALAMTPDYALAFATNLSLFREGLTNARFAYAPSGPSGVARSELSPPYAASPYVFEAWANGYRNQSIEVAGNSSGTYLDLDLASSPGTVNAPVYLSSDTQLAAYGLAAVSGTGYRPSTGTLWLNASESDLAPPFLRVNDYDYPTFVLSAFSEVNDSVRIDGFGQAAASFVYSSPYDFLGLPPTGWTQGYYFFGGSGQFSVANTTVTGNTSLYYEGVAPPAAVEFYGTTDSTAEGIAASQESFGVAAIDAVDPTFRSISSTTGANAVTLVNSTGASATGVTATGTDYTGASTTGAFVYYAAATNLTTVTASDGADAIVSQSSTGLTVRTLTVTTSGLHTTSEGLLANATDDLELIGLTARASLGLLVNGTANGRFEELSTTETATPTIFGNSSHLEVDGLTFSDASTGAWFLNDTGVTVDGANATNDSAAIARFDNSTGGTFEEISVANDALGVNATGSSGVVIDALRAVNESVGVFLDDDAAPVLRQLTVSGNSTAVVANATDGISITGVTASGTSLGVDLTNSTDASVRWVNATATVLPTVAGDYNFNPITGLRQPVAAVALDRDLSATIANVSARYYPVAVQANATNASLLNGVSAWYGGSAVALNQTRSATVAAVFAYGNEVGVNLTATNYTNLTASTIEASSSYGVEIVNGTHVRVYDNNFVANNGASTDGVYAAAHVQAKVYNGTLIEFNLTGGLGNFWSDYTPGSGGYVIRSSPGIVDHLPHTAVVRHWLEFYAGGLPAGVAWGISVLNTTYAAEVPVIYLPGEVVPDHVMAYTVVKPVGYVPTHDHGTAAPPATNSSKNTTVIISFSALYSITFAETGLPAGVRWSATFNGTEETALGRHPTIEFNATTGSYPYSIGRVNGWSESTLAHSGTVTVNSADVRETSMTFVEVVYAVSFSETGLVAKSSWTVTLNGTPASETTTSITFTEPNGSYAYSVTGPSGYAADKQSGTVVVNGATESVALRFNVTATSTSSSSSIPWTYIGIGAGVAVVALVAALLLVRRRKPRPAAPAKPTEPDDGFGPA